ncbi:MAG: ECF-type sigma factor [Gammaproteobacteria bacterium]|nr:ECF-type sigma factor [Gammaproteobacteria bacterium]
MSSNIGNDQAGNRPITSLMRAASAGDQDARNSLFDSIYQELRTMARAHRRRWHGNHTLDTTALINEAYIKLADGKRGEYNDRAHFFATASRAMRQILINYAEKIGAAKRGGNRVQVTLSGNLPVFDDAISDLLDINAVLEQVESANERYARLFECRVFGGMTIEETALVLDVSPATVKRDWSLVSAWIYRELRDVQAGEKGEN